MLKLLALLYAKNTFATIARSPSSNLCSIRDVCRADGAHSKDDAPRVRATGPAAPALEIAVAGSAKVAPKQVVVLTYSIHDAYAWHRPELQPCSVVADRHDLGPRSRRGVVEESYRSRRGGREKESLSIVKRDESGHRHGRGRRGLSSDPSPPRC